MLTQALSPSAANVTGFFGHVWTNVYYRHLKLLFNSFSYTELNKNPVEGFSAGLIDDNDLYRWEVLIIGPPDTL